MKRKKRLKPCETYFQLPIARRLYLRTDKPYKMYLREIGQGDWELVIGKND